MQFSELPETHLPVSFKPSAKDQKDPDAELKTQFEQIGNERSAKLTARPQIIAELTDKRGRYS